MVKLQIVDGIFTIDNKYGQFTLKQCRKEGNNTFWLSKPYPNVLGKSMIIFKEPYAVIFPGVENFPDKEFDNGVVTGKIFSRDSDQQVSGTARMIIGGGIKCCCVITICVTVDDVNG